MTDAVTDTELVLAARQGQSTAFGVLVERHEARLYATALRLLGSREAARDAVQEGIVIALSRLDDLREPAAGAAWLTAIVRNVCLMQLRGRREMPAEPTVFDRAGADPVQEALERVAIRDWLWTALRRLSPDLQATVILRHFTTHSSYAEIAGILGLPIGTVRSRLNQAQQRLTRSLLGTAAATHQDHKALVAQRWAWWSAAEEQITRHGSGSVYADGCVPDVWVAAPSVGYEGIGIADHQRDVEDSVAAGVRLHVTQLLCSSDVTVIDGVYENPPGDRQHCPATHTEIRFHPQGRTQRLILHYE